MSNRLPRLALIAAGAVLVVSAPALAGEPPNQNDPCGKDGRNTCGTTGVGSYQSYRYGTRWFGDYRGAIAEVGRAATFCLDLRYWYPGKQFAYKEVTPDVLRNREGKVVGGADLARMSYAIWNYGRSNSRNQQAATMLYVHGLMDDGAPGEVAKNVIGPGVESIYDKIERDANKLRGPYRLRVDIPGALTVAEPTAAALSVESATGAPMANVSVRLASAEATGVPATVRTDADGQATFSFTPTDPGKLALTAVTEPLAATTPRLFFPTTPAAARNGQRLATAQGKAVEAEVTRAVSRGAVKVTSRAFPQVVPVGGNSRDTVFIQGASPTWKAEVSVALYGPFPDKGAVKCTGTPAATSKFTTDGKKTYVTAPSALPNPGWYTYQISVPQTASYDAVVTPCGEPTETFRVVAKPTMTSKVSAERITPGQTLSTAVSIKGLAGQRVPIDVKLFGPFPTREALACTGAPIQAETLTAAGDGTYSTTPLALTTPGFYVYTESSGGNELVEAANIGCGDPLETAIVVGTPKVVTQVSAQELTPGGTLFDTLTVTGLGTLKATINLELWGPYTSKDQMVCSGTPAWTGTVEANGDGTYTSAKVKVNQPGYYTYRERISEAPQNAAEIGVCGEAAETTIVKATPDVTTTVSNAVVRPGSTIQDRLKVTGAGSTPLDIELALYGPFPSKAAMRCNGTPFWQGTVKAANGDGMYTSPPVRVDKAGFYTYRERIAGSAFVTATEGQCGEAAETSLGVPAINTGGTVTSSGARASQAGGDAPTRVVVPNLRIDTPVAPVGIDVANQQLDVPKDILRAGWWRDGAAPGDGTGSVLIAGHVDSAKRGAGAFFALKNAKAGMRVQITAGGNTVTYKVTSVRTMPKPELPLSVFATSGSERLTLVTCGGPFNPAIGHYRDNVVVTAVKA